MVNSKNVKLYFFSPKILSELIDCGDESCCEEEAARRRGSQQHQARVDAESARLLQSVAARLIRAETVVLVQPGPQQTSSQPPRQKEDQC